MVGWLNWPSRRFLHDPLRAPFGDGGEGLLLMPSFARASVRHHAASGLSRTERRRRQITSIWPHSPSNVTRCSPVPQAAL